MTFIVANPFPTVLSLRILRRRIDIHFPPAVFKLINFKILLSALFDAHSLTLPSLTSQLPHWVKLSLKKVGSPVLAKSAWQRTCRQAHYRCRIYLQLGVKAAHFAQKSFIYSVLPNIFRQTTEACTRWKEKGASHSSALQARSINTYFFLLWFDISSWAVMWL